MGIEPTWPAWKAGALPLSYTRVTEIILPAGLGLSITGLAVFGPRRHWGNQKGCQCETNGPNERTTTLESKSNHPLGRECSYTLADPSRDPSNTLHRTIYRPLPVLT